MQVPKLLGGTAGTGEFFELAEHIVETAGEINLPSMALGVAALVILLIAKKVMPKFPIAVLLMAVGALMAKYLPKPGASRRWMPWNRDFRSGDCRILRRCR